MKTLPDDRSIADRLKALSEADEHAAPAFGEVWEAAEQRANARRRIRRPAPLAIAACALIAVAALVLRNGGSTGPAPAPTVTMTRWQSPTKSLLSMPRVSVRHDIVDSLGTPRRAGTYWRSPTDNLM